MGHSHMHACTRRSTRTHTEVHDTKTMQFNVSIRLDVTRKNVLECKFIQKRKTKGGGGEFYFCSMAFFLMDLKDKQRKSFCSKTQE